MVKNTVNRDVPAFVLQVVGSLLFLAVVAALWGVASAPNSWGTGLTSGAFWATLFYAVGVLSAVSLFFISFAQLGSGSGMAAWRAMKTTTMAGFALVVLTVSNQNLLVVALAGFVLASIGSVVAMKNCKDRKQ